MIHETMQFMELADAGHEFRQRRRAAAIAYRKMKGAKNMSNNMAFLDKILPGVKTYISFAGAGIALVLRVVKHYYPQIVIPPEILELLVVGFGILGFLLMNRDNKKIINLIKNGNGK